MKQTTDFYKTSADFHDAVDRYEAHERAEQAERELNEIANAIADAVINLIDETLANVESACDPAHDDPDGSDTSMATRLDDAGFGSGGVL